MTHTNTSYGTNSYYNWPVQYVTVPYETCLLQDISSNPLPECGARNGRPHTSQGATPDRQVYAKSQQQRQQ